MCHFSTDRNAVSWLPSHMRPLWPAALKIIAGTQDLKRARSLFEGREGKESGMLVGVPDDRSFWLYLMGINWRPL